MKKGGLNTAQIAVTRRAVVTTSTRRVEIRNKNGGKQMGKADQQEEQIVDLEQVAKRLGYTKNHLSRLWPKWRSVKDEKGNRILRVLKARPSAPPRFYMEDVLKVIERIGTQNN